MDVDSQWAALVITLSTLLLIIILTAADAALATISRMRLRHMIEEGVHGAESALRLIEDGPHLRNTFSLLNLLLVATVTAGVLVASQPLGIAAVVKVIGALVFTLVLQAVAGALGARWYQTIAPAVAPLIGLLALITRPPFALLARISRNLSGSPDLEDEEALRMGEEELRVLANVVGDEEADLAEEGREMIYSIVTLSQTTVREVMIPRPDIVALRSDMSMLEALDVIISEGHSRIPVYEEGIDNIIGVLYAKDLLAYLRDSRTDVPIRDMLRPALFVPSSKMADELLQDLQRGRIHLAIVFDEYGGTAGIVTIEDILEEIVGEIQDEYDSEEEPLLRIDQYEAVVSGLLDIDDLNREMNIALPTDENDTVGGLIYSALGRIPLVGDEVRMEEATVTFRVMAMAGRRISTVRVLIDHAEQERGDGENGQGEEIAPRATEASSSENTAEIRPSRIQFR